MFDSKKGIIEQNVKDCMGIMLDAERWIWEHPQTGFNEWDADRYLTEKFTELGYTLTKAGNIPGFYTDVDTGKAGPTLCILGELDALDIDTHPEAKDGVVHACGHNAQVATLLGIAAALKMPGTLDGMSGKIRLMAVPAEETIQLPYREELRQKGVIQYFSGKTEFMRRGFFDDVDIALLVHANTNDDEIEFKAFYGSNGILSKTIKYKGIATHAGGAPHLGVNAGYAAALGLQACNNLRETFKDEDHIRFHPVSRGSTNAVNVIPDEVFIESFLRGKSNEAIAYENKKINRALAGSALAMGAQVEIKDRHGCSDEIHDPSYMKLVERCCNELVGEEKVEFDYNLWVTASSDFGDITAVMPGMQFNAAGASGVCHSVNYFFTQPDRFCGNSAKVQLLIAHALLENDAKEAKNIIANYKPAYKSIKEYIAAVESVTRDIDCVRYSKDGEIFINLS